MNVSIALDAIRTRAVLLCTTGFGARNRAMGGLGSLLVVPSGAQKSFEQHTICYFTSRTSKKSIKKLVTGAPISRKTIKFVCGRAIKPIALLESPLPAPAVVQFEGYGL
jgi:hypothetical protein